MHEASIRGIPPGFYSRAELESWASGLHMDRYIWAMNFAEERYVLAEVDGEGGNLAGFCSWLPAEVKGLYIHPAWLRRGVAGALMDHTEQAIVAAGAPRIRLSASRIARPFYEKRGYRTIRRLEWKSRGQLVMEAFAMEKAIRR